MKYYVFLILYGLLLFALPHAQAEETAVLKIENPIVIAIGSEEVAVTVDKTEQREPRIRYKYHISCIIKNVSDEKITVITRNIGPCSYSTGDNAKFVSVDFSNNAKASYEGSLIIPSASDLGLIVLHAGECAVVSAETGSFTQWSLVKIAYNPVDHYGNRFGYWTGRISAAPVKVLGTEKP